MPHTSAPAANATRQTILEHTRALAPQSVNDMLDAGFARILLPQRIGGYGLGFDTAHPIQRAWREFTSCRCTSASMRK
jgi:hypothetical protein